MPTSAASLARALNRFGFALWRQLEKETNTFASPFSVGCALSMLVPAAREGTLRELQGLLRLGDSTDALPKMMSEMMSQLQSRTGESTDAFPKMLSEMVSQLQSRRGQSLDNDPETHEVRVTTVEVFRLQLANALFPQAGYAIREDYLATLSEHFGAQIQELDYASPQLAADEINAWVKDKTQGMIDQLVVPTAFTNETRLVVANAVYFFAEWAIQFKKHNTSPEAFFLDDGRVSEVPTMKLTADLRTLHDEESGVEVVELAYRAMSMVIMMPQAGDIEAFEQSLDADEFERLYADLYHLQIELELPRFECEHQSKLRKVLGHMGLSEAMSSDEADFSGASDHPDGLAIGEVIHSARIKVDENGTEAAAVTPMVLFLGPAPMEQPKPKPFKVNRPFVFVIRDDQSGACLFVGRVGDASSR